MTPSVPQPSPSRMLTIPLGVMDVEVHVHPDGVVTVASPSNIPSALQEAVSKVLETWAIELKVGARQGTTILGPRVWREYFASRTREVAYV